MLMQLGPVTFDLRVNPQTTGEAVKTPYAVHEVVGAPPLYEFMGEGESTFTISGVIFPEHFGGYTSLAALETARQGHVPVPLMRGSFEPVGWVLINEIKRDDAELNDVGIGREIRFTVSLTRVGTPSSDLASTILSLFR